MRKLAKKQVGGEPKSKNISVKVSGKMGNLDSNKIRSNQKNTGNNYTFTKVKPGSMSGSDSSYVNRFSKSKPMLTKKQNGGPQQPSTKPTTSTELVSKNYIPRPNSNRMRPDSTVKADPSKFDPSKVSKGLILKKTGYKKLGGSTKK